MATILAKFELTITISGSSLNMKDFITCVFMGNKYNLNIPIYIKKK